MEDLLAIKEKAFNDCLSGKELWTQDGTVVKNLKGLSKAIKKQDDYTFTYHVNDESHKNDYAKWVMDVIGDKELCTRLLQAPNNKEEFLRIVDERIDELTVA